MSTLLIVNTVNEVVWAITKNAVAQLDYVDCIIYLIDENTPVWERSFEVRSKFELSVGMVFGNKRKRKE